MTDIATDQIAQRALTYPEQARKIAIVDDASYRAAAEFLKGIKALSGEIDDTFDPHIKRLFDAHRALCREKADAKAPAAEAERIVKDAIRAYDDEQERRRLAEQRRLEELAAQEAREQRLADAVALAEQAVVQQDPRLQEAADELLAAPIEVPAVAVPPSTPKVTGISFRETWTARVTDLAALIRYAATNPQFMNLLMINQPALNALARSMKRLLKVPGVEVICTKDVAAGRR